MNEITNIKKELGLYQWDKQIRDTELDTIHTPHGNLSLERVGLDTIDIPYEPKISSIVNSDNVIILESLFEESELTKREVEILQSHYGLNGTNPTSLIDMSELFGLTPCRINQIRHKAMRKLKKGKASKLQLLKTI